MTAYKKDVVSAREKIQALTKCKDVENQKISSIKFIEEIFDDIDLAIISKSAKTIDIYNSIKNEIGGISYDFFRKTLSRIRKEKGKSLREIKSKSKKVTISLSQQKTQEQSNKESRNISTPNVDHIVIDENFISPLADKDRTHYTSEDYQAEWDLVEQLLKAYGKSNIQKYRILGGDINDISGYNLNTSGGRRQSYTKVSNLLDIKKCHYQDFIRILK